MCIFKCTRRCFDRQVVKCLPQSGRKCLSPHRVTSLCRWSEHVRFTVLADFRSTMHPSLVTVVVMPSTGSSELIHLLTESLVPSTNISPFPPPSGEALFHSLLLRVAICGFHIEVTSSKSRLWLISRSVMPSGSIRVAANGGVSSFFFF